MDEGSQIMQLTVLKAKLHRACVTHAELDYEGSCAIDEALMEAAGIHEYEQIHIYNIANGERLVTYAIRAERYSRVISVNGAAAHKASPGDRIIICSYATLSQQEMAAFRPTLVYLNERNEITDRRDHIPLQVA
jgi:aspartate 1-decarboxylase